MTLRKFKEYFFIALVVLPSSKSFGLEKNFIQEILSSKAPLFELGIKSSKKTAIDWRGYHCDYLGEAAKFKNAFYIWLDNNTYHLLGIVNEKIRIVKSGKYYEDPGIVKLRDFWGKNNLALNLKSLNFGAFYKGSCIQLKNEKALHDALTNCEANACDHN